MKPLADADARARIRGDLDAVLVVEAAAGTGKTTALVERVLALVQSGRARLATLVAVTFTEKAAGEMKLRLRDELERARSRDTLSADERGRLDRALAELEEARISTIHGFCADLLRERPIEARVDPLFEVAAEEEQDRLFDEAFERWFSAVLAEPGEGVRRVLRRQVREHGGHGPRHLLSKAGRDLVEQRDFPSGWRREPFDRAAVFADALEKLELAASYAPRAFKPDDFLAQNLANIGRFLAELGRRETVRGGRDLDGLEADLRGLASAKTKWTWRGGGNLYGKGLARKDVLDIRNAAKARLDEALALADADLAACLREELRPLVASYEDLLARAGKLDFLDLLRRARDLVRDDAAVRKELAGRFSHILVDEFQDTDPLQAELLLLLAAVDPAESDWTRVRVAPGKLFLVGDPKQSIYRFRRADVALYETIKRRLAAAGADVLALSTSFRSSPAIQRVVNAAFAPVMTGGDDGSQATYVALTPSRDDRPGQPSVVVLPVPRPYGDYGKIVRWRVDESYPDAVGAFVEWLTQKSGFTIPERSPDAGAPPRQIPIEARHVCLLFKRFQSFNEDVTRPYVRALEARRIPHVLMGGRSYHAREEVLALRNALSAIEWPDDELSVYATLRGPLFSLGDDVLLLARDALGALDPARKLDPTRLPEAARDVGVALSILGRLHAGRNRRPIADTLERLLSETRAHAGIAIWPAGEQALANLLRMMDLARRFESAGATSFRAFVERVQADADRRGAAEAPVVEEGTDGVRMMTVHRSKGLEFPVVILVDPTAPLTHDKPSRHVDTSRELCVMPLAGASPIELLEHQEDVKRRDRDEAVRLAYVAATRARELLVVPGFGDPWDDRGDTWLEVLSPAVYPERQKRRRPAAAPGCPPFGDDSVVDRPAKVQHGPEGSIAPGLHVASVGAHEVVWWDPHALELSKEHEAGLRQERLLVADESRATADEGTRAHERWVDRRAKLLARGVVPSVLVASVTEQAHAAPASAIQRVTREVVPERVTSRPGGTRFGTLVHAVLAELPLDADEAGVRRVTVKQARLLAASSGEIDAAVLACVRALAHPRLRAAAAAAEVRREVPVVVSGEDGALVEGVIDLAYRDGGGWVVVDFKTDLSVPPVGPYDAQVGAYVDAIGKATGASVHGSLLFV